MTRNHVALFALLVLTVLWTPGAVGSDRGLSFSHQQHLEAQDLDCTDCHGMDPAERSLPNHQVCSICHDTGEEAQDAPECSTCHTREDHTVDSLAKLLSDEIRFDHDPHRERQCSDCHSRAEMAQKRMPDDPGMQADGPVMPTCKLCHPDPDSSRLLASPAKGFCVDCHQEMGESRAACTICHTEITGASGGPSPH